MNTKIFNNGLINGVKLIQINDYHDQSGTLSVLVSQGRDDAPDAEKIGEVYLVSVPRLNTTRGSHKHNDLDEFFLIIEGSAKFFLLDDRKGSSTFGRKESFTLNSEVKNALFVPKGVYHAFTTLTDNTKCLAISNNSYDKNNPDVYPIPFSKFTERD